MPNAIVVCRPLLSFPIVVHHLISCAVSSATIIVRLCHCCLPLPSLSAAAVVVCCCCLLPRIHHCHSAVSTVSHRLLLSFPIVVHHLITCAVTVCCHRLPPLPSFSAAVVFCCRSHHHHSAVSALSHHPLSSFSLLGCRPILHAVVVCRHCCPSLLLSTIALIVRHRRLPPSQTSLPLHCLLCLLPPSLIATSSLHQPSLKILVSHCQPPPPFLICGKLSCHLSSTIIVPLVTADVAHLWQSLIAAIFTSCSLVPPTLACIPRHLLPQSASAVAIDLRLSSLLL
jgi:hypothetical protein